MATKNIVPRGNLEGNLGTEQKRWSGAFVGNLDVSDNITFPNGTITDIATQAEAEAGTDNTKVMTPLRAKNAINKQRPLKTYTSLSQLGLTPDNSLLEIYNALPNDSMMMVYVNKRTEWDVGWANWSYVFLKQNAVLEIKAIGADSTGSLRRVFTSWNDTGWKKLATNGALSMPSNNSISITIPNITPNTSSYNQVNDWYVAPADGWVIVKATVATSGNDHMIELSYGKISHRVSWHATLMNSILVPVKKGDVLTFGYINISAVVENNFVYAQSEV